VLQASNYLMLAQSVETECSGQRPVGSRVCFMHPNVVHMRGLVRHSSHMVAPSMTGQKHPMRSHFPRFAPANDAVTHPAHSMPGRSTCCVPPHGCRIIFECVPGATTGDGATVWRKLSSALRAIAASADLVFTTVDSHRLTRHTATHILPTHSYNEKKHKHNEAKQKKAMIVSCQAQLHVRVRGASSSPAGRIARRKKWKITHAESTSIE